MSKRKFKIGDVVASNLDSVEMISEGIFESPRLCVSDIVISENNRIYLECYYFLNGVLTLETLDSETVFLIEE